ncbi:MAG: CinA family protein [bacterium]|nr:CinA family protein [bacterium]
MKDIIEKLIKLNKTISTMESCTGGGLVNEITNIEGSSEVLKYSAVTYSNEFKIKMGVDSDIIDKYSVYSIETAMSMASSIARFTNSNYGVGITGKLNKADIHNNFSSDNIVFISIYDSDDNKYYNFEKVVDKKNRALNKKIVIESIINNLSEII